MSAVADVLERLVDAHDCGRRVSGAKLTKRGIGRQDSSRAT
ncbi:MAG: hypothetical protein WAL63_00605 [Solirubrobacteraceae bacterium]